MWMVQKCPTSLLISNGESSCILCGTPQGAVRQNLDARTPPKRMYEKLSGASIKGLPSDMQPTGDQLSSESMMSLQIWVFHIL